MILNVPERLIILSIIPKEGDYMTLRVLRELRLNLGFSEEELAEWGIEQKEGNITWQDNAEADIPVGEKASGIIVDALRDLDKKGKLEAQMMDIYEKFIPTIE